MMEINAKLVKELRDRTSSSITDCKKALEATNGNIEEAIDWLRKKGVASAEKKANRSATEGVVSVIVSDDSSLLLEINTETDFVAKNDTFQKFVKEITSLALENPNEDINTLLELDHKDGNNVNTSLKTLIATIGENIVIRRMRKLKHDNGKAYSYVHNASATNMGAIGVVVLFDKAPKNEEIGKQIAMHIAATKPMSLSKEDLDPQVIEKEKEIQTQLAEKSGKPAPVIAKMIEGRLAKFYQEVCLLEQNFVMNPDKTISDLLKENATNIVSYAIFILGEGLEKKTNNFADEVAAAINN